MNELERVRELAVLASAINDGWMLAEHKKGQAGCVANEAVKAALLTGQAALRAKELEPYGRFGAWLKKHCPKVSKTTLERWMRLANASHVMELEECRGLRQAYIAVGILPKGERMKAGEFVLSVKAIAKWAGWFRRKVPDSCAVLAMGEDERAQLRDEIAPIARLHAELVENRAFEFFSTPTPG